MGGNDRDRLGAEVDGSGERVGIEQGAERRDEVVGSPVVPGTNGGRAGQLVGSVLVGRKISWRAEGGAKRRQRSLIKPVKSVGGEIRKKALKIRWLRHRWLRHRRW